MRLRHACFFGRVGCFGDRVFDLEVVRMGAGPVECDLQCSVEFFECCVCGAGEGAEDRGVGDVVGTEVDFQDVVLTFTDAFVGGPVCGLAVFACCVCLGLGRCEWLGDSTAVKATFAARALLELLSLIGYFVTKGASARSFIGHFHGN